MDVVKTVHAGKGSTLPRWIKTKEGDFTRTRPRRRSRPASTDTRFTGAPGLGAPVTAVRFHDSTKERCHGRAAARPGNDGHQ